MTRLTDLLAERGPELAQKLVEHVVLTGVSTAIAVVIGLALGIALSRRRALQGPVMAVVNALQTIPSLALLAILLPLFGIGMTPALIALTLYALLPIVRNTLTGIDGLPEEILEACQALGFTDRQRLWQVELPLALPTIMAGIRTAAVISVGVATLAAFIGAGGLGDFIVRGLAVNNNVLVLLGAVPAALLALGMDRLLLLLERRLRRRRGGSPATSRPSRPRAGAIALAAVVALLAVGVTTWRIATAPASTVVVASKNFTEQYILAELMAQMLEAHTDLAVERKLHLGSVHVAHNALLAGEIDLYPEYTGTAWRVILDERETLGPTETFERVRTAYRQRLALEWIAPFGFENTYAILVTEETAEHREFETISDLVASAPELVIGFASEFHERSDGYPALRERYGLRFADTAEMDLGLLYRALRDGRIDVAVGNSTDGRIPTFRLRALRDDLGFFPPYDAAAVLRADLLGDHPEVGDVLARLSGRIDTAAMQRMNRAVDRNQRSPSSVAAEFLATEDLAPPPP